MKSLPSLIRWRRFLLDERRKGVAQLYKRVAELEAEDQALAHAPAAEQPIVAKEPALGFLLGGFVGSLLTRRRQLAARAAELAAEIETAQEGLREAFTELKRYEVAAARLAEERRQAEALAENKQLDEIAGDNHRRRQEN